MAQIDTIYGTMEAEAWHVGKHISADPSGYNWRIIDEDIDDVIRVLENPGMSCVVFFDFGPGSVKVMHKDDGTVVIQTKDTRTYDGTHTTLSDTGRVQFLEVLRSVAHLPNTVKQETLEAIKLGQRRRTKRD